jgi:hypothetical protein
MSPRAPSARGKEQTMHMRDWHAIQEGIDRVQDGKINSTGRKTLCAGSATTTLPHGLISENSFLSLEPHTESAQNDRLSTTFYIVTGDQTATIHHSLTGSNPRIFKYAILG